MSGEYNTFNEFIKSNKLFLETIESKETTLDFNIAIEIILLFLKTRFNILTKLDIQKKEILEDIIMNDNYQIIDNKLVYNGEIIELNHLLELVKLVREQPDEDEAKIYYFSDFLKEREDDGKLIHFPSKNNIITFIPPKIVSYEEKSKKYNATREVDKEGLEYIRETNIDFRKTMNQIIDALLKNDLNTLEETTLKVISGLLDIYSLNYYYKCDPKFISTLKFPIKKIGIGKENYSTEEIKNLEQRVERFKQELIELMKKERYLTISQKIDANEIQILKLWEDNISLEIMNILVEIADLKEEPSNYNPHLIESLMHSIEKNNVEISTRSKTPVMLFFNIDGEKTTFHATMSLETFDSIVDKDDILEQQQQLKKRV